MILTGLAKDDFLSWYGTGEHYFVTTLKPIEQYANIVEWLDSVGLMVEVSVYYYDGYIFEYKVWNSKLDISPNEYSMHETRQQATEAAIKLANKVYNNR